ncbi:11581_t:CDS:2, partial [Acaulospora colombiana]
MLLLDHFGATWLFTSDISLKDDYYSTDDNLEDFKFAALVVQLACVEIRLMLDEVSDKLEKKDFSSVERHETMLPACYTILEKSIEYLSQVERLLDFDDKKDSADLTKLKLDPELLLRLRSTMIETFRIIMEYLLNVKDVMSSIESILEDKMLMASIRVLSVWLAEEGSLEKEAVAVIPFLIDMCRRSFEARSEVNLIKMLTPAFLNLSSQDQPRSTFYFHGGHLLMIDYIVEFWGHTKVKGYITNVMVDNLLGPFQVLINIVVSDKEELVTRNEKELISVINIGHQILRVLAQKLRSEGYPSSQENQSILLANVLLLCLLIISGISPSSDLLEKEMVFSFIDMATAYYLDQNKLFSQDSSREHLKELTFLGQQ